MMVISNPGNFSPLRSIKITFFSASVLALMSPFSVRDIKLWSVNDIMTSFTKYIDRAITSQI